MATAPNTSSSSGIRTSGIGKRMIQEKILTQDAYIEARDAAQAAKKSLISYLVENKLAAANDIAQAASAEYGMPMLDLAALRVDMDAVMLVTAKLIEKTFFPALTQAR